MRPTERNTPNGVLERATAILTAFDPSSPQLSISELSRRTGLPKSTVHRLGGELCRLGALESNGGRLQLGMLLFELGELAPRKRSLQEAALPFMEDLRAATGMSVHLAILDGLEVVYLEILRAEGVPPMPSRTGGRLPAHATGVGKAILAFSPAEVVQARIDAGLERLAPYTITQPGRLLRELSRIRIDGVAYDREESRVGICCVAAPVIGPGGVLLGGLSVSGVTARLHLERMAPAVRTAAFTLSRVLTEGSPR